MGFRFEFDPVNKILLVRFEGQLTDESLAELYKAFRKYSNATDAGAGIMDLSSVTEFAIGSEFLREWHIRHPPWGMRPGGLASSLPRPRLHLAYLACSKSWGHLRVRS